MRSGVVVALEARALMGSAAWSGAGFIGGVGANFLVVAYAVRQLGSAEFGTFALFNAVVAVLLVLDGSLALVIARQVAAEAVGAPSGAPSTADELTGTLQLCAGAVLALSLSGAGLAVLFRAGANVGALIALLGVATAIQLWTSPLVGVATGNSRFRLLAGAQLVQGAVMLTVLVASIDALALVSLGLAQAVGVTAARTHVWLGVRRGLAGARGPELRWKAVPPATVVRVLRDARPILLLAVVPSALLMSTVLVLNVLLGSAAVGLYRLSTQVPVAAGALLFRCTDVVFPRFASEQDPHRLGVGLLRLVRVTGVVAGAGTALLALHSTGIVRTLFLVDDPDAGRILALAAFALAVNAPAHVIVVLLIARGRQHRLNTLLVCEFLLHPVLTFLGVRALGTPGAAWAAAAVIVVSNAIVLPRLAATELVVPARAMVLHGYLAVAVGCIPAAAATALTRSFAGELQHFAASTVLTGLLGLPLLWAAAVQGRRGLRRGS